MAKFDFSELDEFEKNLLGLAEEFERGKEAKKFLRQQGNKLNKENKKQAKLLGLNVKTGNFMKGFKRGKVYKYQGKDLSIRAYNSAPHAHLLDLGHRVVAPYTQEEKGFKKGYHFMEKAEQNFEAEYYDAIHEFLDTMLEKGL